jgi:NAD(P)-dependent dehydrogenase (short-subunit alcohol dehydrogenase family)
MQKCEAARQSVLQDNDKANVACLQLDVSSFESVKSFAKTFKGRYKKIDVLINNAGVMALPTREVTKDGLEMQIATNHYGHFLLTSLLLPMITKNGRIVNHSSGAHTFAEGNFPYENLSGEKYDPWVVYGNTKLANLHFTYALNRKLAKSEKFNGIKSIAVQPGYTSTNLQSGTFLESFNPYVGMTPADGALSQILAAADPAMSASEYNYFGPKYGAWGAPALVPTLPTSWDVEKQEHLWKESTRITKTKFHNL